MLLLKDTYPVQIPKCDECGAKLGEMRKDDLQLMICLEQHALDQREKYERQGWTIPETPIATHRLFDRCLLDGPTSRFENEVTCNSCKGWEFIDLQQIPYIAGTRRRASQALNQRITTNLRNRMRRQVKVCGVSNNRSVKTLCAVR